MTEAEFGILSAIGVGDNTQALLAPEATAVRENVESVIQQSLRETLGAQFTEKEAERLIKRSFNTSLSEEENAKRLGTTIRALEGGMQAKDDAARFFDENGTLKGFTGAVPSVGDFDEALDNPEEASDSSGELSEGTIIRNPSTGERLQVRGGQFVPIQ